MNIDWNIVLAASIAALPATLVALGGLIQTFRTHKLVNSGMHQLVESTRKEATATATLVEKKAERKRQEKT